MFLGIIPIIMAAAAVASTVASAASAASAGATSRKQAALINAAVKKQKEIEKNVYELRKKQRNLEDRELDFGFLRDRENYRSQHKAAIFQNSLNQQQATLESAQMRLQTEQARFSVEQGRSTAEQQLQQERGAVIGQTQQGVQQVAQGQQQLQGQAAQRANISGSLGQDGSARSMAALQREGMQDTSLLGSLNTVAEQGRAQANQNYSINSRLFDLQSQAQTASLDYQQALDDLTQETNKAVGQQNIEALKIQRKAFNVGKKAEKQTARFRLNSAREADMYQHESTMAQLDAGMVVPPDNTANILGAVAGGIGQIAGAAPGLFGSGGGPKPAGIANVNLGLTTGMGNYAAPSAYTGASQYRLGSPGLFNVSSSGGGSVSATGNVAPVGSTSSSLINSYPPGYFPRMSGFTSNNLFG